MTEEIIKENTASAAGEPNEYKKTLGETKTEVQNRRSGRGTSSNSRFAGKSGGRRNDASKIRKAPEFEQKIISIRRVTRVVSGGRRFSFSVAMLLGDKKGSVGIGMGKANDTALAIGKAIADAKKRMITVKMTKTSSVPHLLDAKYASARVMLMPNKAKGLVAGSSIRDILMLAGMKDVTSKIYSRSKNKVNIARAAILALDEISTPYKKKESKPVSELEKAETSSQ